MVPQPRIRAAVRIALVHSFYSSRAPSGENAVVESEYMALRRAGYEVKLFAAHTDHLEGSLLYPIRAAFRVATGRGANPLKAIRRFGPDIVHIHNLFPNFGRRWVEDIDVPIIHTVHNYRPLCANGLLFRDGKVCTECPDGNRWQALRHACYRGSRLATLPNAWANRGGPMADPLFRRAHRLLMLTPRQRALYVATGVPIEKTALAPNFLPQELDPGHPPASRRRGCIYVGRLSAEKGITRLLRYWPDTEPLRIIGDGPQRDAVEALAATKPNVSVLGQLSRSAVIAAMRRSRWLVFPSLWLEGFPVVYPEALACDLPILAFQPSALSEIVKRERTGVGLTWDDAWPDIVADASDSNRPCQGLCRHVFEERYSERAFHLRYRNLVRGALGRDA